MKICATSIELAPQNLQARVNQIELYDALIRSDLPNAAMQSVYLELFEQAIENLKQLPNSEVEVMESRLLFLIAQVANYAKEIDLDKVYSESESIIQTLENKTITAKFANRAGVIRQRHINHLLRQGKNASELAKLAHAIVDKGLALEPTITIYSTPKEASISDKPGCKWLLEKTRPWLITVLLLFLRVA